MPWKQWRGDEATDGCGVGCFSLTAAVIWFNGLCVTTLFVLYPWLGFSTKFFVAFGFAVFLTAMTSWAHVAAGFMDPGWVPSDARPLPCDVDNKFLRRCRTCDVYKPERAVHCATCGHCVVKIDHHCPFINNCVGMLNQKFFILFTAYGSALGVYSTLTVAFRYYFCLDGGVSCGTIFEGAFAMMNVSMAIVFFFFSFCVLCNQCQIIASPTYHTMGPKMADDMEVNYRQNLREIFGGHGFFNLSWLVPTTPRYIQFEEMVGFTSNSSPWISNAPEQERRALTL